MLLFRSEEHAERWRRARWLEPGAFLTVEQLWALARAWYGDKLEPGWRRKTPSEAQATLDGIGLTGPFWRLAPP